MSKSKFIHTFSESKNTFALEQKAIIVRFVNMLRFYWDTRYMIATITEQFTILAIPAIVNDRQQSYGNRAFCNCRAVFVNFS